MSIIKNITTPVGPMNTSYVVQWDSMGNTDIGKPLEMSGTKALSVQVVGTFGGATTRVTGSNDGTTFSVLTDPQGHELSFTSPSLGSIQEVTRFIRPETTGGTDTSVSVHLFLQGS